MTPFRSHGRGTLVLKGSFAGIRIERASGTNDPKRVEDLRAMLRTLVDAGRLDVIESVAIGALRPLELWSAYRRGDWTHLPTAQHAVPLAPALAAWRVRIPGERHRADMLSTVRCLLGGTSPTIAELPARLQAYRVSCQAAGTARMFNKARSAAAAFIRDTLTPEHPLWLKIRAVPPLPVKRSWRPQPQRPESARMIANALSEHFGSAWWAMCCTGMMPDEYFGRKWGIEDGRLHVKGTKREHRDRFVPLVVPIAPSLLTKEQFQRKLRRAGLGVRPYDGRHTFAHWCDLSGIPAIRKDAYLGHAVGAAVYGWHESERFLVEDEAALRALLSGIVGGTGAPVEPASPSAPPANRTRNLLIKSPAAKSARARNSASVQEISSGRVVEEGACPPVIGP